jgi:hypothetical protein
VTSGLEAVAGAARYVLVVCDGLCDEVWVGSMGPVGAGPSSISSMQRIRAVMDEEVSDADCWRGVVVEGKSDISSSICMSGANRFKPRSAGIEEGCCEVSGATTLYVQCLRRGLEPAESGGENVAKLARWIASAAAAVAVAAILVKSVGAVLGDRCDRC